jgi:deoxyribonuclease V
MAVEDGLGPPIALVDVGYAGDSAVAACVVADGWDRAVPVHTCTVRLEGIADYRPGMFYERELPPILAVLGACRGAPAVVVVDGYVWLDDAGREGLGAHVHDALGVPVVGIAKRAFRGSSHAVEVRRGVSARPLYVTAAGADPARAAEAVRGMHGPHRIPTLLGLVDALSRGRGG